MMSQDFSQLVTVGETLPFEGKSGLSAIYRPDCTRTESHGKWRAVMGAQQAKGGRWEGERESSQEEVNSCSMKLFWL